VIFYGMMGTAVQSVEGRKRRKSRDKEGKESRTAGERREGDGREMER